MKQVILSEREFQDLLNGVKHAVSRDASRPALQYIRIEVANDRITAYALDGYRASRFVIKCKDENADEFTCYIRPLPFKAGKNAERAVIIRYDEKTTTSVQFFTEYGEIIYSFDTKGESFYDVASIFANAEAHDGETCMNAKYLAEAMQALAKVGDGSGHNMAVIEGKSNPCAPMIFRAANDCYENAQLILPIRVPQQSRG